MLPSNTNGNFTTVVDRSIVRLGPFLLTSNVSFQSCMSGEIPRLTLKGLCDVSVERHTGLWFHTKMVSSLFTIWLTNLWRQPREGSSTSTLQVEMSDTQRVAKHCLVHRGSYPAIGRLCDWILVVIKTPKCWPDQTYFPNRKNKVKFLIYIVLFLYFLLDVVVFTFSYVFVYAFYLLCCSMLLTAIIHTGFLSCMEKIPFLLCEAVLFWKMLCSHMPAIEFLDDMKKKSACMAIPYRIRFSWC